MGSLKRRLISLAVSVALTLGLVPVAPLRVMTAAAGGLPADGTVEYLQVVPPTHEDVLGRPTGVSYNSITGQMLVADELRKEVLVYDDTLSLVATIAAGPQGAFSVLGDVSGSTVIDRGRKSIYRIDGSLNISTVASDNAWADPYGIDYVGSGVWVVDRQYDVVHLYESGSGNQLRTLTAGSSMLDPVDVEVNGNPFVTDPGNHRVLELDSVTGNIVNAWDTSVLGGGWLPSWLADDGADRLWVLNDMGTEIHLIDHSVVPSSPAAYVGSFGSAGVGVDQMRSARGIAASSLGMLVADNANGRVKILDSTTGDTVGIVGGGAGNGDGQFFLPGDIELDAEGNVYIADAMNGRVQKLDPNGNHVATFGPFNYPAGIGVAPDGTLWVAERGADKIWRVTTAGAKTAFGGSGTGLGQYDSPEDVAVAPDGTVVVSDSGNVRMQRLSSQGVALRAWDTAGVPAAIDTAPDGDIVYRDVTTQRIRTLRAGDLVEVGNFLASGATRIDVDDAGNIYAAWSDDTVKLLDRYGSELLSWGGPGFGTGQLHSPSGVAVGTGGNVWVADTQNNRIQRFTVHDHTPPVTTANDVSAWSADDVFVQLTASDTPGRVARFYTSLDGTATEISFPVRGAGWQTSRTVSREGTTTFGFFAEDGFGNVEATKTALVRIDKTSPTVDILGEPTDWVNHDVTLTVEAYDAHSGIKDVLLSGATLVGDKAIVTSEGTTTVIAQARDNVNRNSGSVSSAPVRIDKSLPNGYVQLLAPIDSNPLPVAVRGYDGISGVDQVYYQLDGGAIQLGPATLSLAFSGEHTITVWASDRAGNVSEPTDYPITVGAGGGDPPAGDFVVDGGKLWTNKYDVPVSSNIAGATEMRYQVAGGAWSDWTAFSTEATLTLPLDEGACTINAEFKNAGGQVTARSVDIGVDRTPGTCTSNIDQAIYREPGTFIFVADDTRSGPGDRYSVLDSGAPVKGDTLEVSEPGSHTVEFWALDLAGNESPHTTRSFRITHPTTLETTVAPNTVPSGSEVTITVAMADETGAPVSGKQVIVQYSYDGWSTFDDVPGTFATDKGDGTYTITHAPTAAAEYRARFFEDDWYNAADSMPTAVQVSTKTPTTTSVAASTTLVNYGGSVTVYGVPTAEGGGVLGSGAVTLWTKPYGSNTWSQKTTATWDPANQRYAASTALTIGTYVQMRYAGDSTYQPSDSSGTLFVRARAKVGNPVAPSTVYRNRRFTTYGSLSPAHAVGTTVRVYKYRYVSGVWKAYGYVNAKTVSASKYSISMTLPYAGRWRLRAYHSDGGHYATYSSGYDYVTVK